MMFVRLTLAEDVAIVVSGGPGRREMKERFDYYRMLGDGFRMAAFCRDNAYRVHCLYDPCLVERFGGEIYSVQGKTDWAYGWTSSLRQATTSRRRATYDSLKAIPLSNGDRVVLYLRSHGFDGGLVGPRGEILAFDQILNCFVSRGWSGEILWLVDSCHSGTIAKNSDAFREAARQGIRCQIITAAKMGMGGHDEAGISNFGRRDLQLKEPIVCTGSYFRHRLMLAVDRAIRSKEGQTTWEGITNEISPKQVTYKIRVGRRRKTITREMGSIYLSFGRHGNGRKVTGWFRTVSGEPNLRKNGEGSCRRRRRHHRVNQDPVNHPYFEQWEYGYFKARSDKARASAMKSHNTYKAIIEGAYKKLGVKLEKVKVDALTKEQSSLYQQILQRIVNRGVSFVPFIPDLMWVSTLVVQSKDSKALLDAFGSS